MNKSSPPHRKQGTLHDLRALREIREDSFQPIETPAEGETFLLKPMNCPHHCEIYNTRPWSYKELPKRYAEFGTVYRYEQSGELHGLTE